MASKKSTAKKTNLVLPSDRSIFQDLMQFREVGGDMVERISAIGVYEIFKPLIEQYALKGDMDSFNKALFYILWLYSKDTDLIVAGYDYLEVKAMVAKRLSIEGKLYSDLIQLATPAIVETVNNYMDYQNSRIYRHLTMVREQYQIMVRSSTWILTPAGMDYEQMRRNSRHAAELYDDIRIWEQKFTEEERVLKPAIGELKRGSAKYKRNTSLRIEDLMREVRDEAGTEKVEEDLEEHVA